MISDIDAFVKAIEKVAGKNEEAATVKSWLDTGFAPLNYSISSRYDGGLPCGRIVEIFGPPSAGKTAIATQAMINAQKLEGYAGFHDHERSFDDRFGERLGLNLHPRFWRMRKIKTYEDSMDNFVATATAVREMGLPMEAPMVFVFDSLASMIPKSKFEKEMGKQGMHDNTALARATSSTMSVVSQMAEDLNCLVILLNQERKKIGVVMGDDITTPGGDAPKFYASVRIHLAAKKLWTKPPAPVCLGQHVTAHVVKNKTTRPYQKASWDFLFSDDGTGHFDIVGSTIDFMLAKSVLIRKGGQGNSHIWWPDEGKSYKRQDLIDKLNAEDGDKRLREMLINSAVEPDVEVVPDDEPPTSDDMEA